MPHWQDVSMRAQKHTLTRRQSALLRRLVTRGSRTLRGLWKRASQENGACPVDLGLDLAHLRQLGFVEERVDGRQITVSATSTGRDLIARRSAAGAARSGRGRRRRVRAPQVSLAPLVGVSLSACTVMAPAPVPQYNDHPAPSFRVLQQVRAGDRGVFVSCSPCSGPTPKTMAEAPSLVALVALPDVSISPAPAAEPPQDQAQGGSLARRASTATERVEVLAMLDGEGASPATRTLSFASGQFRLTKAQVEVVRIIAKHGVGALHVQVRGYTDGIGDARINRSLALARASRVRFELLKHGLPADLVSTTWCTECYVASNATSEGQSRNRRVEVELVLPRDALAQLPAGFQVTDQPQKTLHARAPL